MYFESQYNQLKGRVYSSLFAVEKLNVYVMELFHDGADRETIQEILDDNDLSEEFIDDQLRNTFGYTNETVIE